MQETGHSNNEVEIYERCASEPTYPKVVDERSTLQSNPETLADFWIQHTWESYQYELSQSWTHVNPHGRLVLLWRNPEARMILDYKDLASWGL